MRYLLLLLLILNLAVAGLLSLDHQHYDKEFPPSSETIQLLTTGAGQLGSLPYGHTGSAGKLSGAQLRAAATDTAQIKDAGMSRHDVPELKTCILVGPVKDALLLVELKRLFEFYQISINEMSTETDATIEYWVFMPPLSSKELGEAQVLRLREAGFDSVVVAQGEQRGGISLGLHSSEEAASDLALRLKGRGFDAEVKQLHEPSTESRLVTRSPVRSDIKGELRELLAARGSLVEHKEIICK